MRDVAAHLPEPLPLSLFLTDPHRSPDPLRTAAQLPAGSGIIYRHFGRPEREEMAHQLAQVCTNRGLSLLIAADPQLALNVGADGVHWPQARLPEARYWRGAFGLQTASAHSPQAIWRAWRLGLDAVLVSTVFASNSPSANQPMGATRFRALAKRAPLPLYALGGVQADNSARVSAYSGLASIEGVQDAFGR